LSVINDTAERGVQLCLRILTKINQNEDQLQFLLQVVTVSEHLKQFHDLMYKSKLVASTSTSQCVQSADVQKLFNCVSSAI